MTTVREYFDTDFSDLLKTGNNLEIDGYPVPVSIHFAFDSNTKFLSFYLQSNISLVEACKSLIAEANAFVDSRNRAEVVSGFVGETGTSSKDLKFIGRIFIYHEGEIDAESQLDLVDQAKASGINLRLRGPKFASERSKLEKPLAFISHDSRDKDLIARPIAIGLRRLLCPVWFDEFSLNVGDKLRESIEEGLKQTRMCVVLLTPNFLSNAGWPASEFDAIFNREIIEKQTLILPVWYGVTAKQVSDYSLSLANRFAAQWSEEDNKNQQVIRDLYRQIC